MIRLKKMKRLSLILSPIIAFVLLLNVMGTISISGFAYYYGTSSCPTNLSAVTSYSLQITRSGSTFNATSFASVRAGDKVKVVFDIDNDCTSTNVPISLVSYTAPSSTWYDSQANQRVLYQSKTGYYNGYGGSQEIYIPNCYYSTGFVYGSVINSMTSTNHYDGRQIDWRDGGGSSCSSSTTTTTTSTCPSDDTAITSYYFTLNGGTTRYYDLSAVRQGDDVYAYFTLASGCSNVPVAFAAYTAKEPYWNVNTATQQVYQPATNDDGYFSSGATRMVHTKVPVCYFQIDFVYGTIISQLDPNAANGLYGDRKIEWMNGGTNACGYGPLGQELPTPTPTQTPTKTPTPITPTNTPTKTPTPITPTNTPTKTPTPITPTNTPVPPTNTPVPPTNTPTNTPVPPTNTPTNTPVPPTSTPIPPGKILIHVRDSAGNALGGATIDVQGPASKDVVDNGQNDENPAVGEMLLSKQAAGGYLGTQKTAKAGYFVDKHSQSATLNPGETKEWTFVNLQPGNLNVILKDGNGNLLAGGCFTVDGPSGYSQSVCDGGTGDTDGTNNGTVALTQLLPGTYDAVQTTVPAGYVGDSSNPSTEVVEALTSELVFVNTKLPGSLVISLTSHKDGSGLAGGCFTVTGPNGYSNGVCTQDGGTVRINNLPEGTYTATQTSPPSGYVLGSDIEESGLVPSNGEITLNFVNNQLSSLIITLKDPDGNGLDGCFDVTNLGNVCVEGGVGQWNNLQPGDYTAHQTSGPDRYTGDPDDPKTATLIEGETAQLDFVNTPPQIGNILIHKRDSVGNPLGGACFSVVGEDETNADYVAIVCDGNDEEFGDGNPDGELALYDVPVGNYTITEEQAPDGYDIGPDPSDTKFVGVGQTQEWTFVNFVHATTEPGRLIFVYKLNCTSDPGNEIRWDELPSPSAIPAGCSLAPNVGFDVLDPQGNVVDHVITGDSGADLGRVVIFVPEAWGRANLVETDNPANVEDDSVRISYKVDFTCACQFPRTGAVNLVVPQ